VTRLAGGRWGPFWPVGEAVRFLTLVPVPGLPSGAEERIGPAVGWFPLVGLLLGALSVAAGAVAGLLWGDGVRAVVVVLVLVALTGGLHLDGLADTFDAVGSWRSRERKLEIMRDSRIGTMGVLALVAVLGLKVAFLAAAGERWWIAALVAPVLGRWAGVVAILAFPSAREGGLGRTFRDAAGPLAGWVATAIAVTVSIAVGAVAGAVAVALVGLVTAVIGRAWTRSLDGLTGDTYGAITEIGEVVALAVLTAAVAWPLALPA
jgi:adenosylcobinamide-GDP ribazoletransferase